MGEVLPEVEGVGVLARSTATAAPEAEIAVGRVHLARDGPRKFRPSARGTQRQAFELADPAFVNRARKTVRAAAPTT